MASYRQHVCGKRLDGGSRWLDTGPVAVGTAWVRLD